MDAFVAALAYLPLGFIAAACILEIVCGVKRSDANSPGALTALFGTIATVLLAIGASSLIPVRTEAGGDVFGWPLLAPRWENVFGIASLVLAATAYGFKIYLGRRYATLAAAGLEGKPLRKALKSFNDLQLGYWFCLAATALLVLFTSLQKGSLGQMLGFLPLSFLAVVFLLEAVTVARGHRANQPAVITILCATLVAAVTALAVHFLAAAPTDAAVAEVAPVAPAWDSLPGVVALLLIGGAYLLKIRARKKAAEAAALAAPGAAARYSFQKKQKMLAAAHRVIPVPYVLSLLLALAALVLAHFNLFSTREEVIAGVGQAKSLGAKAGKAFRDFAQIGSGSETLDKYAEEEGSLGALLMANSQQAAVESLPAPTEEDSADDTPLPDPAEIVALAEAEMGAMGEMDAMAPMGSTGTMDATPAEGAAETAMAETAEGDAPMDPAVPEPASPEPTEPVVTTSMIQPYDNGRFYLASVKPILSRHCYECHGSDKDKGGLRLHTAEAIRKGGDSGNVIIAGSPESSDLYSSTVLSPNDPDIMPAKGDVLTKNETEILRKWILAGAHLDDGVASSSIAGASNAGSAKYLVDQLAEGIPPANPAVIQALEQRDVLFRGMSANAALIKVDFSHVPGGTAFTLEDLAPIASNVYYLDLTRTTVTDEALSPIGNFPNLRKLELNLTGIGDEGVKNVAKAENLEMLNLYGTKVTDEGLKHLATLGNLQKLYLWETSTTQDGIAALKEAIPGIEVVAGN